MNLSVSPEEMVSLYESLLRSNTSDLRLLEKIRYIILTALEDKQHKEDKSRFNSWFSLEKEKIDALSSPDPSKKVKTRKKRVRGLK